MGFCRRFAKCTPIIVAALLFVVPAMASDINSSDWSQTDNSNNKTPPNGWPEGMNPAQVNDTSRASMGAIKRWYDRINATVTSGGTANAQTLTYSVAPTALVAGDTYSFIAGATNTGAVTLNVNGLGAKSIKTGSTDLIGGEIIAGRIVSVYYDGTSFQLGGGRGEAKVTWFGAKCDGSTDDSAAFNAALASFGAKGGRVTVPATGHSCKLASGITLPANVTLDGDAQHHWVGLNGTAEQWAAAGSWIKCADTVNPCVTINSTGNIIRNINFIYDQPSPAPGWTPTTYPWTISVSGSANFTGLEGISITAATHCILWDGPTSGVAGLAPSWMSNINFNGCFNVGTEFHRIDNTLFMSNLRYVNWWNADSSDVVAYMEAHKVDWDVRYLANAQANGVEFYQSHRSIQFMNDTVTSGFGDVTFAASNLQLTNVSFNEVCQAFSIPNGNGTATTGMLSNVIVYGDTTTNCPSSTPVMFDLASDQANWSMSQVNVGFVQTFASVGAGAGGILRLNDIDIQKYSAFSAGAPAFKVSANASFWLGGGAMRSIRPNVGAGAILGPGVSGQGYVETLQVGTGGGVEGWAQLKSSQDSTFSGSADFFRPDGTRGGWIGRTDTSGTTTFNSDRGAILLKSCPSGGCTGPGMGELLLSNDGVKTHVQISGSLPTSCSGQPTGSLWNNSGNLGICP